MIIAIVSALGPVAVILLISEVLWRTGALKGERARKFIHILSGTWVAFWPFYLPFDGIFILSAMMLALLVYSRVTNLFAAIYDVKRKTYGDILYAAGLMACAYFAQADWIFTVSVLFLALADGGAAVVGRYWGRKNTYLVLGMKSQQKSISGTVAFILLAQVSLLIGLLVGGETVLTANPLVAFVVLPVVATILENIMPYGFDNLATPLVATVMLNSLL